MTVTIWHNPKCGTSRNVLAMIRASGVEPVIVDYLKDTPDPATLTQVAALVGGAKALLRTKGTPALELGLDAAETTGDAILAAMQAQPILIERPIVITPKGTVLARPSERVLAVLDGALPADFRKEDGMPVVPLGAGPA